MSVVNLVRPNCVESFGLEDRNLAVELAAQLPAGTEQKHKVVERVGELVDLLYTPQLDPVTGQALQILVQLSREAGKARLTVRAVSDVISVVFD